MCITILNNLIGKQHSIIAKLIKTVIEDKNSCELAIVEDRKTEIEGCANKTKEIEDKSSTEDKMKEIEKTLDARQIELRKIGAGNGIITILINIDIISN